MKTKSVLWLSLALNGIFIGVGFTLSERNSERLAETAREVNAGAIVAAKATPQEVATPVVTPEGHALRWSDLIADDDTIYAGRLRAIGCPEETIRDIVTSAIAHRYDSQRQHLEAEHRQGRLDANGLRVAVAQSWQEQNQAVNRSPGFVPSSTGAPAPSNDSVIQGTRPNAAPVSGAGGNPPANGIGTPVERAPRTAPGVRFPMALSDPPASVGLNETQAAAAASIADTFSRTVGSQNLSPEDPAYHQLWKTAQQDADDALKARIGWEAFNNWQMQGHRGAGK